MTANRIRLLRLSWAAASLTLALLAGLPSSARITADRNATTAANKSDELDFGVEREENCFAMCVARCRTFSRGLQECGRHCEEYRRKTLCDGGGVAEAACWSRCRDLLPTKERHGKIGGGRNDENTKKIGVAAGDHDNDDDDDGDVSSSSSSSEEQREALGVPKNLSATYESGALNVGWSFDEPNQLFTVQFKRAADKIGRSSDQFFADSTGLRNFSLSGADICERFEFRVAAISPLYGVGAFSASYQVPAPEPTISKAFSLVDLRYRPVPFQDPNSPSNGTITIVLGYNISDWPLGDKDLEVVPLFHVVKCAKQYDDYLPNPIFYKGEKPGTIEAQATAEFMYLRCTAFYLVDEVQSKQCARAFKAANDDDPSAMKPLEINCETVANSGCALGEETRHPGPQCGFIANFDFELLDEESIDWNDADANLTVEATFDPIVRKSAPHPPLYHIAFYGPATQYTSQQAEIIAGVNVSEFVANASTCETMTPSGHCALRRQNNTLTLTNLRMDELYGERIVGLSNRYCCNKAIK